MEFTYTVIKSRKPKLILWPVFSILLVGSFIYVMYIGDSAILNIVALIGLIGLILMTYLTTPIYSWTILSFLLVFLGMYFKKQHWPFANVLMSSGTLLLGILSFWNSIKFMIAFRNNQFLKWIGFIAGAIVTVFMLGLLCGYQHWPGRAFLGYSGSIMFIMVVMAMVFTLPNSNYIEWSIIERKVFFRTVLIPMIFVFALITLMFVFPDTFNAIIGKKTISLPWEVYDYELFNIEGIPLI